MDEPTRLTDKVGIIGIDATDYGELEEQQTTVAVDLLRQALDLIDTLGWEQVDVLTVEPTTDDPDDQPMVILRPPHSALFGPADGQAGIAVTPRTEQGRRSDE